MKKTALVLATVAALAVGTVGTTTPAQARWGHGGWGWGPGIAGGLLAGAVIGGIASSAYGWGPGYGYYGGYAPAYYGGYGGPYVSYAYARAYSRQLTPIAIAACSGRPTLITAGRTGIIADITSGATRAAGERVDREKNSRLARRRLLGANLRRETTEPVYRRYLVCGHTPRLISDARRLDCDAGNTAQRNR